MHFPIWRAVTVFQKLRVAPWVCPGNLGSNTTPCEEATKTKINDREFQVKQTGNKFYYWSTLAGRWLPVAKSKVIFEG